MKKPLICIKDELKGYGNVSIAENVQVAYRDFYNVVNSNEAIKLNLKDFSLYQVGTFDTELGLIEEAQPKLIVDASSCIRKAKDE